MHGQQSLYLYFSVYLFIYNVTLSKILSYCLQFFYYNQANIVLRHLNYFPWLLVMFQSSGIALGNHVCTEDCHCRESSVLMFVPLPKRLLVLQTYLAGPSFSFHHNFLNALQIDLTHREQVLGKHAIHTHLQIHSMSSWWYLSPPLTRAAACQCTTLTEAHSLDAHAGHNITQIKVLCKLQTFTRQTFRGYLQKRWRRQTAVGTHMFSLASCLTFIV